jgi:hypothetical protein
MPGYVLTEKKLMIQDPHTPSKNKTLSPKEATPDKHHEKQKPTSSKTPSGRRFPQRSSLHEGKATSLMLTMPKENPRFFSPYPQTGERISGFRTIPPAKCADKGSPPSCPGS